MLQSSELVDVLVPFVRSFTGGGTGTVQTLVGDASTRRYHRVRIEGGGPGSAVVMELPDEPLKSEEATGGGTPPELPFLNVQRYLAAHRFPVPLVYGQDLRRGLIALEDLGDRTFESMVAGAEADTRLAYYRQAIDKIVSLQQLGGDHPDSGCIAFSRRFDQALLRWELDHFREWYLEAERGVTLDATEASAIFEAFDWLSATLAGEPVTLVHRDFQSRNLMWVAGQNDGGNGKGAGMLKVIDFQDALLGTRAYDLVALLRDSYVALSPVELDTLIDYFVARAAITDAAAFRRLFVLQALQRKLKDVGRFVFIDRVRKNPSFLRWIPTTVTYIRDALPLVPPELATLRRILIARAPEFST